MSARLSICFDAFAGRGGQWEPVCFNGRFCPGDKLLARHAFREFIQQSDEVNSGLAKPLQQICRLDPYSHIDEREITSQAISVTEFVDGGVHASIEPPYGSSDSEEGNPIIDDELSSYLLKDAHEDSIHFRSTD